LIFVSVGSQKFQMNRLLVELDRLKKSKVIQQEIVAQIGNCTYIPKHFPYQSFFSREEMEELIGRCDLLICHGGTGTIFSGIRKGKKVIVVPRQSRFGEHVDDHQRDLAAAFEKKNFLLVAWETADISEKLAIFESWEPERFVSNTEYFIEKLRDKMVHLKNAK